jgi:hypothetical protein
MTPDDRAELTRLIIDTLFQHAKGDPDVLARRIVEEIEAKGSNVAKPIPIRNKKPELAASSGLPKRTAQRPNGPGTVT